MHRYRFADLLLDSDIDLPLRVAAVDAPCAVTIRRGKVPARLQQALARSRDWEMARDQTLYRRPAPTAMNVLINGGCEIIVESASLGAEGRAFLIGPALGTLLHQRGALLMHAAAVQVGEGAVLVLGASGAGKSTAAAALIAAGYPLLTDDLCVVSLDEAGRPMGHSDGRPLKLTIEAAAWFGMPKLGDAAEGKFYVAAPQIEGPLPIAALVAVAGWGEPRLERLKLLPTLAELRRQVFNQQIVSLVGREGEHFVDAARLAAVVPLFKLTRPHGLDRMAETIDLVRRAAASQ
jgi:hypothetical protein